MPSFYTEADYENFIIELFQNMVYRHVYDPDLEQDFRSPLYEAALTAALHGLNTSMLSDAFYKLKNFENPSPCAEERAIYGLPAARH